MKNTKIKELMTVNIITVKPNATLKEAAAQMRDTGCGILPVGSEDKIQGIITDRDIVIRAIARGKDPSKEQVGDYMTENVYDCSEMETLKEAAAKMYSYKVSRLIVKNKAGRVTGIITFGDMLRKDPDAGELTDVIKNAAQGARAARIA